MQLTIISHIFNESFLLPFWLNHHTQIFDHGVIIDYGSTDGSLDICRDLAPHWEVVRSRDDLFYAEGCDQQVMEQERRFPDWKMALNVTEFLFHPDPHRYLEEFDQEYPGAPALWTRSYMMVDPIEMREVPVDPTVPLVLQRHHGIPAPDGWGRERLLHRAADGRYYPGRHQSALPGLNREDLLLLWYNYSPYEQIKHRKLQIQKQLPQSDIDLGRGHHHIRTEEQLDAEYVEVAARTTDLQQDPLYLNSTFGFLYEYVSRTRIT